MKHISHTKLGLSLLAVGLTAMVALGTTGQAHAASVQWGACPPPPTGIPDAGQQCATISVPKDYRKPSGEHINVAISRVTAANPSKRRGILLTNPGGPGGSGIDLPRVMTIILPQSVLDSYDIIGMDPRGIGASTPVTCGLTATQANQAYVPLTQNHSFADTTAFVHSVADGCAAHSGNLMPYITTANTARDMDQIRQSLGEQKVSYLGYSYGTYLGAVYASLFPAQTDRIVLDSSVNPDNVWRQVFRDWGPAGDSRFNDFTKFAAANDSTYHLGTTQIQIDALYFQLIAQTAAHPYTVPAGTHNGLAPDGTVLTDTFLREVAFSALYDDASFPSLAQLFHVMKTVPSATAATTPSPATTSAPADNEAAAGLGVVCDDTAWPTLPTIYQVGLLTDKIVAPKFGELGSNIWPCAFWHSRPLEQPVAISSNGPTNNILVVQDERDPATPYAGGVHMRTELGQRARLISADQGGHAAYELKPNLCVNDTVTAYLANGTYPQSDVNCPANPVMTPLTVDNSARAAAVQHMLKQMRP